MKKILITAAALTFIATGASAQLLSGARSKMQMPLAVSATTSTLQSSDGSSVTIISPGLANISGPQLKTKPNTSYPVGNGGIIIPDHSFEPAGTAGVGFFGNGTGGNSIGSTPASGGTGLKHSMAIQGDIATGSPTPTGKRLTH